MKKKTNNNIKLHIKRGDKVRVIAGNHKGGEGEVLKVHREKLRASVQGVNLVTKHVKPTAEEPEGGIKRVEGTIHVSNLMVIDPATGEPTRTGRRRAENGKLKRYSKKTQEFID